MEAKRENDRLYFELPRRGDREPWRNYFRPDDPVEAEAAEALTILEVPCPQSWSAYKCENLVLVKGRFSGVVLDISTWRASLRDEAHNWAKAERESARQAKQHRKAI